MKRFARAILPAQFKTQLRSWIALWDVFVAKLFSGAFEQRASWFYRIFNTEFNREQIAVLAGRNAYHNSTGSEGRSSPLLRRNIHRLEKGLCMPLRRDVFAVDYIVETVQIFAVCVDNSEQCLQELSWADAVLDKYFACIGEHAVISTSRPIYSDASLKLKSLSNSLFASDAPSLRSKIPYTRKEVIISKVNFSDFNSLCVQRRSVRWFTPQVVSDELLNIAIETAAQAPSACNRQPFRFYVANDPKLATRVATLAGGTVGFADNIPCTVVVVGDLSAYPLERDRHLIYIDAALASMQLMLALETLGLSSCPINWPDLDVPEQKMAKLLSLKAYERPIMLMAIGYAKADGLIPFSQKKSINQLRIDIH
ncbi:nitroreductase family protein [Shewanella baltica]|uniref:nitroreductase family protein n=1 Tax=Shewanella baltica TaxID=62322 RepID=UPI00217D492E|nr:nitroreductase family protein [Shewanella baltica]MCS6238061.1 nitroreductase family protein [Shewanella baltica]